MQKLYMTIAFLWNKRHISPNYYILQLPTIGHDYLVPVDKPDSD